MSGLTATPATTIAANDVIIVPATNVTPVTPTPTTTTTIAMIETLPPPLSLIPATGKVYIRSCGAVVFVLSLAELIVSSLVVHNSSGYYVGGLYIAIMGILTSTMALNPISIETLDRIGWLVVTTSIDLIVSLIALAIISANYHLLNSFKACANYASVPNDSCGVSVSSLAYVQCYGNEDYFLAAYGCELEYLTDQLNNNDGASTDYCTCVTESVSDDATCYNYDLMFDCEAFLQRVPSQERVALVIMVFLTVALMVLWSISYASRYFPDSMMTRQEREERERNEGLTLRTSLLVTASSSSSAPTVARRPGAAWTTSTATPATVV